MPKIVKPLTNTQLEKAKAGDILRDGQGLNFEVSQVGTKTFLFYYSRPHDKKRTKRTIGQYPATTLAQARAKREEWRALLARGIDPKTHEEQQRQTQSLANNNTFRAVAEQWKAKKAGEIEAETLERYWRALENHILPDLGAYPPLKSTFKASF